MAVTVLQGSDLVQMTRDRLGALQNPFTDAQLLSFLNDGKDEVWKALKSLEWGDYFLTSSQNTTPGNNDYFPNLSTGQREYTLPTEFRHMKHIEVLSVGYEDVEFVYRDMSHPTFKAARRSGTSTGAGSGTTNAVYVYDIVGQNTLVLAQYPEIAFQLKLWYVKYIYDFLATDSISDFLLPYTKKMVDYAVKIAMLSLQDSEDFEEWSKQWRESLISTTESATPRNTADPQYVQDFEG